MGQARTAGPWSPKAKAMFWALGDSYSRRLKELGYIDEQTECGRFGVVVEAAFITRSRELGGDLDEDRIKQLRCEFIGDDGQLTDFGLSRCDEILNEAMTDD